MEEVARHARAASTVMQGLDVKERNNLLLRFKDALIAQRVSIEEANELDKQNAQHAMKEGHISSSMYKRLDLSGSKFQSSIQGINDIIQMEDPIGICTLYTKVSEGLELFRVTCPIGVIAVIFEARPEAAIQITSLAIKSGNAVILKGGKEAVHSNQAIVKAFEKAVETHNTKTKEDHTAVPVLAVQLVDTREEVIQLLQWKNFIDLVIPRGSKELIKSVMANTSIPVLGHADGLCSVYVDDEVDVEKAVNIISDSKINYPAACNAAETLLVHRKVLRQLLEKVGDRLGTKEGVTFRADEESFQHLPSVCTVKAVAEDFETEFLNLTLAVKTVDSIEEAIAHINRHGSHHTDCIITTSAAKGEKFMSLVDSASVYKNCSTRFADGFRYGFGAEVGISTNKIHARGPVGLEGLVTYKYRMYGEGHTVGAFRPGQFESIRPVMSSFGSVSDIRLRFS